MNAETKLRFEEFSRIIHNCAIIICCGIGKTFVEVNDLIEHLNPRPYAVIVDYAQNVARTAAHGREMLDEYLRQFQALAVRGKFAGILCSQVAREAMYTGGRPQLHNLKESGGLEQIADMVWLLDWPWLREPAPDYSNFFHFNINVAKNRNGPTKDFVGVVNYYPQFSLFSEYVLDGRTGRNTGVTVRDAMKRLKQGGENGLSVGCPRAGAGDHQ